jgi:membrane associated rhomboid family serine protease
MLPLWDSEPHRRVPVMTMLLIAANLGVFAYQLTLMFGGGGALNVFVDQYALTPRRLISNFTSGEEWLTVFTSMFLHGSVAHVLGNCWFLWIFGNNIEDSLGPFRYLLLYLISGVGAAALQVLVYPAASIPMLGASGAISGVLGAYLCLHPFSWIYTLVPWIVPILPLPAIVFLPLWFGVQAFNGFGALMSGQMAKGGVAWWAHAGGFVAGFLMVWGRRKARRGNKGVRE